MGGMGYSADLGTQMSTSGDSTSGASFSFGGINNGAMAGSNSMLLIGVIALVALFILKK